MPANVISHLPGAMLKQKTVLPILKENKTNLPSMITQNKILIVDDEPYNLDAMRIILQCATSEMTNFDFKARVEQATNGMEAVELIKQGYEKEETYILILMDCNMPKLDGYEATKYIREHITNIGKEQPYIIAISGHVEEDYRQRAINAGMNIMIPKPAKLPDIA